MFSNIMDSKPILRQPYNMTVAKYKISVGAKRVLLKIVESLQEILVSGKEIDQDLFGDKLIILKTRDLLPEGSQNYSIVKKALKELRNIDVTVNNNLKKEEVYTGFILEATYLSNNSFVKVKISSSILPSYLLLRNGFTKFSLPIAFNLSSSHTIRIYIRISHWKKKGIFNLMKDEMRESLGLGNKYPESTQFKNFILRPAQRELKEKSDVFFEIGAPIKEGKKTIGWKIIVHTKNQSKDRLIEKKEDKIVEELLVNKFKLGKKQAKEIIHKVTENNIKKTLYEIRIRALSDKNSIENIGAYTQTVFRKKFDLSL